MSRRKNEKERLARRAAYQQSQALAKPFKVGVSGMSAEEFDIRHDLSTAYHESGHAVAAWMQGIDASMSYVPKGTLTDGKDFTAVTNTNSCIDRFITSPKAEGSTLIKRGIITDSSGAQIGVVNDGGVTGYREAFITLAGPFAEIATLGEILPKEVYAHTLQIHVTEAQTELLSFTLDPQMDELKSAFNRIVDLVERTFQEPRVIACVCALAERFHKARTLNKQEVRETIEAAWAGWREHADSAQAGK